MVNRLGFKVVRFFASLSHPAYTTSSVYPGPRRDAPSVSRVITLSTFSISALRVIDATVERIASHWSSLRNPFG
jgi:hypothetical protein